jgi:EipB-like
MRPLRRLVICLISLSLLMCSPALAADLVPHRAEFIVRLGTAVNGAQIGTARQRLSFDCRHWRIERDVGFAFSLTAMLKYSTESRLRGEQTASGSAFAYELERRINDYPERITGKATSSPVGGTAEIKLPARTIDFAMPGGTALPVAAIAEAIDRLKAGQTAFSFNVFDPEVTGDVMTVDGGIASPDMLRPPRVDSPAGELNTQAWPVTLAFSRTRFGGRPLFTLSMLLYDTGVMDRINVSAGLVTAGADLVSLVMEPRPDCPLS